MLRYSNLIENDLTSFHYNTKFDSTSSLRTHNQHQPIDRSDVLAVRKILLDDYITEVKEIIRSELSGSDEPDEESQIMNSVRKRIMDEDVIAVEQADSKQTLSPSESYITARECSSSCCFHENSTCHCKDSGTCLKFCQSRRRINRIQRGRFKSLRIAGKGE